MPKQQQKQEVYRFCLSVPENLKVQAKSKAALERTTLAAVIQGFLEAWIAGEAETFKPKKKKLMQKQKNQVASRSTGL